MAFSFFFIFSTSNERRAEKHYFHALAGAMAYVAERQKLHF
jgi:hypothetical protein